MCWALILFIWLVFVFTIVETIWHLSTVRFRADLWSFQQCGQVGKAMQISNKFIILNARSHSSIPVFLNLLLSFQLHHKYTQSRVTVLFISSLQHVSCPVLQRFTKNQSKKSRNIRVINLIVRLLHNFEF